MQSKNLLLPVFACALVLGTLFTVPSAFAQTPTPTPHQGFFQGLITFLEQRFGLDKTQVQSAINDYHNQVKANITPRPTLTADQMQSREKSRLDQLVTQGKINSSQEQAILTELSSLNSKYNLQSLSGDQRKTQMQAMQNELKSWATSQGIDPSILMFGMRPGGPRGFGMHGARGNWGNRPTPTPTPGS